MIEIVFAGRSNVGKSTLFSQLFGVKVRRGKRPGTTIKPNQIKFKDLLVTDLPGFGYISGVNREFNERVKDFIVRYIEENADRIILAIQVVDGKSFLEIAERWEKRGYIPVEIEMFEFLNEICPKVFLAVNKMDKVDNPDEVLDAIALKLGMTPPWKDWTHVIFPISAKEGKLDNLREAIKNRLMEISRSDLIPVLKGKKS
jgi:GTP-binding protein EngB required for normal cell division